ncbi:MAG: zinc-binding alcohol dehydrogenase family protein [Verrucomicrobiota bacterium]
MRAIQFSHPKSLEQIEIDAPSSPAPHEALVRTHRMGVCGTDISSYLGTFPFFEYPRIPGHELGVEVLEIGDEVANVKPGDHCSVEPYMNCGTCFACRSGHINCCETLNVIGIMSDGGLCDRFLIPAHKLHPSASLSLDQLALIETLAIGCHATQRANPKANDQVLIVGAGPIGLSALEFVRQSDAKITVLDRSEARLSFCESRYPIEHVLLSSDAESNQSKIAEITSGDLFPIVIDATGNPNSMANALNHVAHTGTLVFLGVTQSDVSLPDPLLHRKEVTIKASRNALPEDFLTCIQSIEQNKIDTSSWITHRTDFKNAPDDFATFTDPASGVLKAIIEVA